MSNNKKIDKNELKIISELFSFFYSNYLKDYFFKITDLDKAYGAASNLTYQYVYPKFVAYKLNSKAFPNITIDFRIKKASDNIYKIYMVFPGLNVYKMDDYSILVNVTNNNVENLLIDDDIVTEKFITPLKELEDGKRYYNILDIGTYDVMTLGEYVPSDFKCVNVTTVGITELLSFRGTDLEYNIDILAARLLNSDTEEERKNIIYNAEKIIYEVVNEYVSHIVPHFILNTQLKTRVIGISVPPHLHNDIIKYRNILIRGTYYPSDKSKNKMNDSQSDDHYIYATYEKTRLFVDKFITAYFMYKFIDKLKNIFNKLKLSYILVYDINYFNYLDSNIIKEVKKCYDSAFLGDKCIKRQTLDIVKLLLNNKLLGEIIDTVENKGVTLVNKYSLHFLKETSYILNHSDIIRIYHYIRKKVERQSY